MDEPWRRLHAIDYIKAAAIIAVVFTHAGSGRIGLRGSSWDFVVCSVWVRFHVPAFLFVSGLLYARRQPVGWRTVRSRLSRLLVPYVLASGVAHLVGVTRTRDLSNVFEQLATASALGIYYYVALAVPCILCIWPLSRMPLRAIWLLFGALLAFRIADGLDPTFSFSHSMFWSLRNPLRQFGLGFFVSGWLVSLTRERFETLDRRHGVASTVLALAAVAGGMASFTWGTPLLHRVDRIVYAYGVVAAIAMATHARPAGAAVRFLSEGTLGLYLYHHIFQLLLRPTTNDWPDPLRIASQVAVGLGGASLVVWAGRRLLGPRPARQLLGA